MESLRSFILSLLFVVALPFSLDAQSDRDKEGAPKKELDSTAKVHKVELKHAPLKEAKVRKLRMDSTKKQDQRMKEGAGKELERPIHPEKEKEKGRKKAEGEEKNKKITD